MADTIASNTRVYIWLTQPTTQRIWLRATELVVDHRGEKVLRPTWDDEMQFAGSWTFEYATILRRRLMSEGYMNPNAHTIHFSLHPTGEPVGNENSERSLVGEDNRTPMFYKNLVARPGFDVKLGRVWYVKFPGNIARESLRGETVEEVVDRCYEMGLQASAEQAPPPPAPEPPKEIRNQPRQRPGDWR